MRKKKEALYPGGRPFPAQDTEGTESLTQKNLASSRKGREEPGLPRSTQREFKGRVTQT